MIQWVEDEGSPNDVHFNLSLNVNSSATIDDVCNVNKDCEEKTFTVRHRRRRCCMHHQAIEGHGSGNEGARVSRVVCRRIVAPMVLVVVGCWCCIGVGAGAHGQCHNHLHFHTSPPILIWQSQTKQHWLGHVTKHTCTPPHSVLTIFAPNWS